MAVRQKGGVSRPTGEGGRGGEGDLIELSMDTWLTVCKEDDLPQVRMFNLR